MGAPEQVSSWLVPKLPLTGDTTTDPVTGEPLTLYRKLLPVAGSMARLYMGGWQAAAASVCLSDPSVGKGSVLSVVCFLQPAINNSAAAMMAR